jgi:hypothetical protein
MRQDQFEALQKRGEQLVDVFISESDPEKWPGVGLEPAKMDKTTRGDRYWCKKDAVATLACAQRIFNLVQVIRERSAPDLPPGPLEKGAPVEDSLDKEVAAAESEATKLLDQVLRSSRKATFDKHVHKKG